MSRYIAVVNGARVSGISVVASWSGPTPDAAAAGAVALAQADADAADLRVASVSLSIERDPEKPESLEWACTATAAASTAVPGHVDIEGGSS